MKFEQFIREIQRSIKIPDLNKNLTLNYNASQIYPFLKECGGLQLIWLSEKEFIELRYINVERYEKTLLNNVRMNKFEEDFLQKIDEPEPTSVEVRFKKSQITQALHILFALMDETNVEPHKMRISFNKRDFVLYDYNYNLNENEILIENFHLVVNIKKFLEALDNNIKEENVIEIIVEELNSFTLISEKSFHYESYYRDEEYLYKLESNRLDKIQSKK